MMGLCSKLPPPSLSLWAGGGRGPAVTTEDRGQGTRAQTSDRGERHRDRDHLTVRAQQPGNNSDQERVQETRGREQEDQGGGEMNYLFVDK